MGGLPLDNHSMLLLCVTKKNGKMAKWQSELGAIADDLETNKGHSSSA